MATSSERSEISHERVASPGFSLTALLLYLLAFAIPFGSLYPLPFGGANVTIADALVALLLALWFARGVAERRIIIPRVSLRIPFALFFGAVLLSLLSAASFEAFAKEAVKWLELFAVYALVASQIDERTARHLLIAIFLAGIAEALVGIYQYYYGVGPEGFILPGGTNIRAFGTFEQPNPFAGYLALIAPVALGAVLTLFHHRDTESLDGTFRHLRDVARTEISIFLSVPRVSVVNMIGLLALVLGLTAIWASYSRGAWLAVGAALVATIIVLSKRAAGLFALAVLLVIVVALLGELDLIPDFITARFAVVSDYFGVFDVRGVVVNDANYAIVERMAHWQAAWGMFLAHPWTGVGFGNYAVAYPQYSLPFWDDPLGHAHNYPLNLLAETGLIGEMGYLIFWFAAFVLGWRAVRRARQEWKMIAAGLLGTLVALTMHNLFDNLFVHSMQIQVGITLGLLETLGNHVGGFLHSEGS